MSDESRAPAAPREIDSVANYVSRMAPEAFTRMTARPDPTERRMRKAQAVFWVGMAIGMVVMVQANDFL
ncbi:MAG: hypothetical protein AAF684_00020 [Pseudomonadota bacterium]